jgi:tRNA-dihydrouridine synthase
MNIIIIMELHLAPLYGISCWAFRATCVGATDSYTEMIDLNPLLGENWANWDPVDTYPIPGQFQWIQILTNNVQRISTFPAKLRQFQQLFPERGAIVGVNINAGCPGPAIIKAGQGAALIKRTTRLLRLIEAFLGPPESHPFKISVKLRLGLNAKEMQLNVFLPFLEALRSRDDPRIFPTIIHFKHAEQSSDELERWELLEVALDAGVPLIINGGIKIPADVDRIQGKLPQRLRIHQWQKGVRGIMIGRASIENPDVFLAFNQENQPTSVTWKNRLKSNLRLHPPESRFSEYLSKQFSL